MEHTALENSMVFVYAALLFAYGSFTIIYIFLHTHSGNMINTRDSFLLYYVSLFLAAVITSMGLWNYGIRKRRYSSSSS
jgi:drug/metabolite transporter (DMT)-like permease